MTNKINNIKTFFSKKICIFFSICVILFIVALILFFISGIGVRRVFVFQSLDNDKTYIEVRYLPKVSKDQRISQYVDELLLGPTYDRYRPLFPVGTEALYCFSRDKTVYIDLSAEAILKNGISSETYDGYELLKKNILSNFQSVKNIVVFMMGTEVYVFDKN